MKNKSTKTKISKVDVLIRDMEKNLIKQASYLLKDKTFALKKQFIITIVFYTALFFIFKNYLIHSLIMNLFLIFVTYTLVSRTYSRHYESAIKNYIKKKKKHIVKFANDIETELKARLNTPGNNFYVFKNVSFLYGLSYALFPLVIVDKKGIYAVNITCVDTNKQIEECIRQAQKLLNFTVVDNNFNLKRSFAINISIYSGIPANFLAQNIKVINYKVSIANCEDSNVNSTAVYDFSTDKIEEIYNYIASGKNVFTNTEILAIGNSFNYF